MDLMSRRRALLARVKSEPVIDTSPRIAHYGVKNPNGNPGVLPYVDNENYCITEIYSYTPMATAQTFGLFGGDGNAILYHDETYVDYWSFNAELGESTRNVINANSNRITCTLKISMLDDSYGIMRDTGEILFAGRNTPYYGYTNINDMPTGT